MPNWECIRCGEVYDEQVLFCRCGCPVKAIEKQRLSNLTTEQRKEILNRLLEYYVVQIKGHILFRADTTARVQIREIFRKKVLFLSVDEVGDWSAEYE